MNSYKEVEGCLIEKSLNGEFDVIAHGCNCFCTMKAGIAPQMAKTFRCDKFIKEYQAFAGNINKLGTIDYRNFGKNRLTSEIYNLEYILDVDMSFKPFQVVNAYTQYEPGSNLDYEALTLCLRKINHIFKGKHIGLPGFIGAGLAGGDISRIREIIRKELSDCETTVVFLPQNSHIILEEFR